MFNSLASYLLGYSSQEPAANAGAGVAQGDGLVSERDLDVRLTAVQADDDDILNGDEEWMLVDAATRGTMSVTALDRDSEGDTDINSSLESIPDAQCRVLALPYEPHLHPITLRIARSSSTSSLPCANFEESWFITPPPCFTSAGPINMETSPLENLLIEHPSMSVYQHGASSSSAATVIARRHNSAPSSPSITSTEELDEREIEIVEIERPAPDQRIIIGRRGQRRTPADAIRQQERQCNNIKNAQKLQIHKACQSLKRNYFERNNKAREVNCRNHRQRRGERSQGILRSNANNNRKC